MPSEFAEQVPPLAHESAAHRATSVWQRSPVKSAAHWHVKDATPLRHVPPLAHGSEVHSLMSPLQFVPVNPVEQIQLYAPAPKLMQKALRIKKKRMPK